MLHVIYYHYVRDLPRTAFPRIKGMLTSEFRTQVAALDGRFEMATLESALAFLNGTYRPSSDLCLLTFDDGLKEHYTEVTPVLAERGIQGIFFLITGCQEEQCVAPVHMNHFLTAALGFDEYRAAFLAELGRSVAPPDIATVRRTYPWDTDAAGEFKYLFNFVLGAEERDEIVRFLFQRHLGDEKAFSRELYLSWAEAREMQRSGMALGGHTHRHRPLCKLQGAELQNDLVTCRRLLDANLGARAWPFCYPYGKRDSFTEESVDALREAGFHCSFTTESGDNVPGVDRFLIHRVDCKKAPAQFEAAVQPMGD